MAAVIDGNVPYEPQTELGSGAPEERRLDFRAEPGERNSLRVTRDGDWILFRDRGAPLTATGFASTVARGSTATSEAKAS